MLLSSSVGAVELNNPSSVKAQSQKNDPAEALKAKTDVSGEKQGDECARAINALKKHYRFQRFMSRNGAKLQAFQKKYAPKAESVFYPFGGPDLLHPLLLFPDAKTFVLVGLEHIGNKLSPKTVSSTFHKLDSLLHRGFFVTSTMAQTFEQKSGVWALLSLQIRIMGGKMLEEKLLEPNILSLTFEWNGETRAVYYVRKNLAENLDDLFEFLKTHHVMDVCLFKATSYCPHKELFAPFKTRLLEHFSIFVQNDSGIPLKDLEGYDIKLFGKYASPYGCEFRGFQQNDLKDRYATEADIPPLNFCFGYGAGRVQANMIIARRRAAPAAATTTKTSVS